MAYKFLPDDLADRFRAAGLKVVEVPGWQRRGRPASVGSFAPVGVLWHHTGSSDRDPDSLKDDLEYAKWLFLTGRSDLNPPLCQISVGRDGTVYVGAAGRANHAGEARASGPVRAGDGNALYVGVECQNNGTEGWEPEQYEAMVAVGVVLTRLLKGTAAHNRAHKETSVTGKWDPGALDMDKFRAAIAKALVPRPPMTRGDNVDAAIVRLRKAKGTGERGRRIKAALDALLGIKPTRKRVTK